MWSLSGYKFDTMLIFLFLHVAYLPTKGPKMHHHADLIFSSLVNCICVHATTLNSASKQIFQEVHLLGCRNSWVSIPRSQVSLRKTSISHQEISTLMNKIRVLNAEEFALIHFQMKYVEGMKLFFFSYCNFCLMCFLNA